MKKTQTKPPVGIEPAFISSDRRIEELAKAIERYSGLASSMYLQQGVSESGRIQLIRNWAKEILFHCDILDEIGGVEETPMTLNEKRAAYGLKPIQPWTDIRKKVIETDKIMKETLQ